jgi:DNA-binding LacI/PurR family transcriptional regulator
MWEGVCDAALEHGVNLVCFSGSTLYDPRWPNVQANVVYDLAGAQSLDGLVLWGAQLACHTTVEELKLFYERYHPLPIVNIGLELEGFSSLLVDNRQGMYDVVTHLIEVHGYRRIVHICGPGRTQEARDRYVGYADALKEHGVPLDRKLIVTGDEMAERYRENIDTGEIGIHILLDGRKLEPGVDFEAVVGRNDGTCWFALKELQARGIRVPADMAMVGFDDLQESRYQTPPLTAARQSFYDQGWCGVEMLLALLQGEDVPERVLLSTELVVRQSCGCEDVEVVKAEAVAGDQSASQSNLQSALADERQKVVAEMARELGDAEAASRWAAQVLDRFAAALKAEEEGELGAFLQVLKEALQQVKAADGDLAAWQGFLSVMRRQLLPYLDGDVLSQAESLWQQARVLVGETARREQACQAFRAGRRARTLREIGSALITTFDVKDLMGVLVDGLPRLDIPSAYLSLYEDAQPYTYPEPAPEWSRLILAYGGTDASGSGGAALSHTAVDAGGDTAGSAVQLCRRAALFPESPVGVRSVRGGTARGDGLRRAAGGDIECPAGGAAAAGAGTGVCRGGTTGARAYGGAEAGAGGERPLAAGGDRGAAAGVAGAIDAHHPCAGRRDRHAPDRLR